MLFYTVLFSLLIISSGIVTYEKDIRLANLFKVITFLLLFLPAAFRYNVGADYQNYVNIFYDISAGGRRSIEPGYWFLNYIVSKYGGGPQLVLAISAFVTLFYYFYGVGKDRWLIYTVVFFIVCWPWYCSTVRQMISCSFAFYAWRKYNAEKKFVAFVFIGLACLFHYSSLIYPFIFFLCNRLRIPRLALVIMFILCVVLCLKGMLGNRILNLLTNTVYGNRYNASIWLEQPEITGSGLGRILRFSVYLLILYFVPIDTLENRSILMLFFIYAIMDVLSSEIIIINRIGRGINFSILLAIYQIIKTRQFWRPIVTVCLWAMLVVLLYANLSNGFAYCVPYRSILSH